jgi:hypothetical protein
MALNEALDVAVAKEASAGNLLICSRDLKKAGLPAFTVVFLRFLQDH